MYLMLAGSREVYLVIILELCLAMLLAIKYFGF